MMAKRSAIVGGVFVKRMVYLWFVPAEFAPLMPPGKKMLWWKVGFYYGRARNLNKY